MGKTLAIAHTVNDTTRWEYFASGAEREVRIVPQGTKAISVDEASFYLYDHLGNTRITYTPSFQYDPDLGKNFLRIIVNNVVDYFPYGKVLREYNLNVKERYLTTQHERDQSTGLDYRGARYYDSDVARFLSLDPLAAKFPAWSAYNYVMGNPISLIDPDGREPADPSQNEKVDEKPKIKTINFFLFTVTFRHGRYGQDHKGINERGGWFDWNYTFTRELRVKEKIKTKSFEFDNRLRGGEASTQNLQNYPANPIGANSFDENGVSLNNFISSAPPNVSDIEVTSLKIETMENDNGGKSTDQFGIAGRNFNLQDSKDREFRSSSLNSGTVVNASLTRQTAGSNGQFDQCDGYKMTVNVQYKVSKNKTPLVLARKAPSNAIP